MWLVHRLDAVMNRHQELRIAYPSVLGELGQYPYDFIDSRTIEGLGVSRDLVWIHHVNSLVDDLEKDALDSFVGARRGQRVRTAAKNVEKQLAINTTRKTREVMLGETAIM